MAAGVAAGIALPELVQVDGVLACGQGPVAPHDLDHEAHFLDAFRRSRFAQRRDPEKPGFLGARPDDRRGLQILEQSAVPRLGAGRGRAGRQNDRRENQKGEATR
jgi:hypothetical protein